MGGPAACLQSHWAKDLSIAHMRLLMSPGCLMALGS